MENDPIPLELEAGTYYFCPCGKTKNKPFCDGSHRFTELFPYTVVLDANKKVTICGCGKSKNFPFCDESHKEISENP